MPANTRAESVLSAPVYPSAAIWQKLLKREGLRYDVWSLFNRVLAAILAARKESFAYIRGRTACFG